MTDSSIQQKLRGAYGRGYHDAIRSMDKDSMTPSKLALAEQSVNGIAAKVLDATPKREAWPLSKIVSELKRAGCNVGTDVALGCLSTMTRTGLVKEVEPRVFQRVTAKPRTLAVVDGATEKAHAEPAPGVQPATAEQPNPQPEDRDTLGKLAHVSAHVRMLANAFTKLAEQIDDVALEVEDRIAAINADSEKLAQLRALLKGIS